jgi:hypothetical protein
MKKYAKTNGGLFNRIQVKKSIVRKDQQCKNLLAAKIHVLPGKKICYIFYAGFSVETQCVYEYKKITIYYYK